MSRKVLLTGAGGLIGRAMYEVAPSTENWIRTSKTNFEAFDLLNFEQIKQQLDRWQPEAIIHTAAITSVDYAETHQQEAYTLNVMATSRIAEWCAANDVPLIYFSTDFVFDGRRNDYRESDATSPMSYYGKTKVESEEVVRKLVNKHAIIRPILVYGTASELARLNFPLLVASKLSVGQAMYITSDQFRMPTYVEDVAQTTLKALDKGFVGTLHLSGPDYVSVYDFALEVADVFKLNASLLKPVTTSSVQQAGTRPMKSGFDTSLAREVLDFSPFSLREGLERMALKLGR